MLGEHLVEQWQKELGVKIKINIMVLKDYFNYRKNLKYKGLARNGWAAEYADPDSFLKFFTGAVDSISWDNENYSNLIEKSRLNMNEANRYKLLAEAEDMLLENYYIIPLFYPSRRFLCKPYVKNLRPNSQNYINWREVYIDTNLTESSLTEEK